ncbi:carbohydrate ABC transporter permease [Nocardia miyunensis]|uniref:carbohydrate ABC transporter permease n=1 Tax=Nocardia miyunensis TaxID=282684 RepID=UPI0008365919|nr:sugar ABC transporter permease [Nocardia miyunensis]
MTNLIVGVIAIPIVVTGWLIATEKVTVPIRRTSLRARVRAGAWFLPAAAVLGAVLIYPVLYSIVKSCYNADGSDFVGLSNYWRIFTNASVLPVLRNNLIWVVAFTVVTTLVGLIVAICADRVRYERIAMTIVMLPTAISLTATAVIFQLMYQYRSEHKPQTGTVSALASLIPGIGSQAWIQNPRLSTFSIILAAVWVHAGIATIILSTGVKAIPAELVEAARIDGANGLGILRHVTLPVLWPTIVTVGTIQVIYALKIFDIVYIMTGGSYNSDVLSNKIYTELFLANDLGQASALSVFLVVLVLPIVYFNIRQLRK